jgi:hypothetical protein
MRPSRKVTAGISSLCSLAEDPGSRGGDLRWCDGAGFRRAACAVLVHLLSCGGGEVVEVMAVVSGPWVTGPDLKMVAASSSEPYPAGAAPRWPSIAGVARQDTRSGDGTRGNPRLAVSAATVATPAGAGYFLGGAIVVTFLPPSPACYPGEIPNPRGLGNIGAQRRLLPEGVTLGELVVWVTAFLGDNSHRRSQSRGC